MPRLFVAARLPASLLPTLQEASDALAADAFRASPVRPELLHLTLRFIGEVGEARAEELRAWFLTLAAPKAAECAVALEKYGFFPSRDGLILWAGLACGSGLPAFRNRVNEGLAGLGLADDGQAFIPHVTLARRARLRTPFDALAQGLPLDKGMRPVPAFALFDSAPGPDGPHYRALAEITPG